MTIANPFVLVRQFIDSVAYGLFGLPLPSKTLTLAAPGSNAIIWGSVTAPMTMIVDTGAPGFTGMTVVFEQTFDGTNWSASAFGKRTDAVSTSPTVAPDTSSSPAARSVWEVPIPATAWGFRARVSAIASGTTALSVAIGRATGEICATLFDNTSAVNTALDTGILDMSGWQQVVTTFNLPGTCTGDCFSVDDTGSVALGNYGTHVNAGLVAWVYFGGTGPGPSSSTATLQGTYGGGAMTRRMQFKTSAGAAVQSRMRVEVKRVV